MPTDDLHIDDQFVIIGGHDTPPDKEKTKIPYSEDDVNIDGMILIQED